MGWLRDALTGPNNCTIAIGRLIGVAIAVVLLIGMPVTAAATIIMDPRRLAAWTTLLGTLDLYVPAITLAIGGLIAGTNQTEPKPEQPHE